MMYAGTTDTVFKTIDGGVSWSRANDGLPGSVARAVAIDPVQPKTIYTSVTALDGGGVYKSTDGAATWMRANAGLPQFGGISMFAIDPRLPSTIYAAAVQSGPEKVYGSTNGGASWRQIGAGIVNDSVTALAVHPRTGAVYAAGVMTSTPFVTHLAFDGVASGSQRALTSIAFSTYLSNGFFPAIAIDGDDDVIAVGDRRIIVQKIVVNATGTRAR